MRIACVALLSVCACTHRAVVQLAPPPVPEPVSLSVLGPADLVVATRDQATQRFVERHHPVSASAPHAVEIEIVSAGGAVRDGRYEYCVKLVGRVAPQGFETEKEKCDVVTLNGASYAGSTGVYRAAVALTTAVTLETSKPNPGSALYRSAVEDLVDVLGRQAVRRN